MATTLGQRLRQARKKARLSLDKIAAGIVGLTGRKSLSGQAVSSWEKGRAEPNHESVVAFAKLTNSDVNWLFTGLATEAFGGGPGRLPRDGRFVSRYEVADITAWAVAVRSGKAATKPQAIGDVYTLYACSDQSFAVHVQDSRNAPDYAPGDSLVIDPEIEPHPNDLVLAAVNGAPVLGIYRRGKNGATQLDAINERWGVEDLKPKRDQIIGVMIEHARGRRK